MLGLTARPSARDAAPKSEAASAGRLSCPVSLRRDRPSFLSNPRRAEIRVVCDGSLSALYG